MAEQNTAAAADESPVTPPAGDGPVILTPQETPGPQFDPKKAVLERHPDLAAMHDKHDVIWMYEFFNESTGTGPHIALMRLTKSVDPREQLKLQLIAHTHIRPDWKRGFKGFPNAIMAGQAAEARKKQLYLANPERVGAEEMFPDAPNRIFEAGKPE